MGITRARKALSIILSVVRRTNGDIGIASVQWNGMKHLQKEIMLISEQTNLSAPHRGCAPPKSPMLYGWLSRTALWSDGQNFSVMSQPCRPVSSSVP